MIKSSFVSTLACTGHSGNVPEGGLCCETHSGSRVVQLALSRSLMIGKPISEVPSTILRLSEMMGRQSSVKKLDFKRSGDAYVGIVLLIH
jgi:hypothetical protein